MILIPTAVFLCLTLVFHTRWTSDNGDSTVYGSVLTAWAVMGACIILLAEGLGLFHALNRTALAAGWIGMLGVLAAILVVRAPRQPVCPFRLPAASDRIPLTLISLGLILITAVTFRICLASPPNNVDSLLYHMPRISHWIQQGGLEHYPTAYDPQLYMPIFSEVFALHLVELSGNYNAANLVQWSSMVIALIGVAAIARRLGGGWKAQGIAALFAASIPMGILQATSTQTDYVTTAWLIITIYFVLTSIRRSLSWLELFGMGFAIAAGALSKITFYPFVLPFLVWYALLVVRRHSLKILINKGIVLLIIFVSINGLFFFRNLDTFGSLFAPPEFVQSAATLSLNPLVWVTNAIDHLFLNLNTPFESFNAVVEDGLSAIRRFLGTENGSYLRIWSWNHEDLAGNPIHWILIALSMGAAVFNKHLRKNQALFGFILALLFSFLVFAAVIDVYPYAVRHHIMFLVPGSALIGILAEHLGKRHPAVMNVCTPLVLISLALPWLLLNRSRPLVGLKPTTMTDSILEEPGDAVLFANSTALRGPYRAAAEHLIQLECREIGLEIDSHEYEFPIWWFFDQAGFEARIEAINPPESLKRYMDPNYNPCAILSTLPPASARHAGFSLDRTFDSFSIYITE